MHLLTCLACGEKTDRGPVVADRLRPLCRPCEDPGWFMALERRRGIFFSNAHEPGTPAYTSPAIARAFMDWLTRVRAERRNAGQVAA